MIVEEILMIKGPDVIVAPSTSTVLEGVRFMAEADVGSLILRDDDEVKGIFTERDLLRKVVAKRKDPSSVLLSEVMSTPVRSCRLNDDVDRCAEELSEWGIRHLAVIEDGVLVGLISLRDILSAQVHVLR